MLKHNLLDVLVDCLNKLENSVQKTLSLDVINQLLSHLAFLEFLKKNIYQLSFHIFATEGAKIVQEQLNRFLLLNLHHLFIREHLKPDIQCLFFLDFVGFQHPNKSGNDACELLGPIHDEFALR